MKKPRDLPRRAWFALPREDRRALVRHAAEEDMGEWHNMLAGGPRRWGCPPPSPLPVQVQDLKKWAYSSEPELYYTGD